MAVFFLLFKEKKNPTNSELEKTVFISTLVHLLP